MAAHVDRFRQFREHFALLRPFPGRLEFSIRLALACALTTLVVEIYQTPDPALTAYVAFFVMKRDRMESIVISMVLAILISLIVGMLILAATSVIDEPLWRVTSMAVASFCLLFLASGSVILGMHHQWTLVAVMACIGAPVGGVGVWLYLGPGSH